MLGEVDTGLNEIHKRPLNSPLDDDIVNVLRFGHPPHLLQIVRVLVDVSKLVNDDLLITHLDVATSQPINEFSPFFFSFARACVILGLDVLLVRIQVLLITNETNTISEHSMCNMSWQRLNVAHVDESICVCL